MTSVRSVTAALFERYLVIIEAALHEPDPWTGDPRLSLENLARMSRAGAEHWADWPEDELSRSLGCIQGCLAMRGLIDIHLEREASRPMFDEAWREAGVNPPEAAERPRP